MDLSNSSTSSSSRSRNNDNESCHISQPISIVEIGVLQRQVPGMIGESFTRWLLTFINIHPYYITAPCGLRGCKNRPALFPGRVS